MLASLRRWWWCALLANGIAAAQALPIEQVHRVLVGENASSVSILATLYLPEGNGPFPLAVVSHGSPRIAAARRRVDRQRLAAQSAEFVKLGFAVAVPTRRGYGLSEGVWAEGYGGSCDYPDYYNAGLETARDILAVTQYFAAQPFIKNERIVLVGQSAGGWGSIAAASQMPEGVTAVVNFAGGRGSRCADNVLHEQGLIQAAGRYGAGARVPALWVYSENDLSFSLRLARAMFEAYSRSGGRAKFVTAPAWGENGHAYFARGIADWSPVVGNFLAEQGYSSRNH
jgi:dienelactone hydrolase